MARRFLGGHRRSSCAWAILLGAAWLVAAGCSANDSGSLSMSGDADDESYLPNPSGGYGAAANGGIDNSARGGSPAVATTLPKEQEAVVELEVPQSSVNYVYATNPERDSVAVIHAANLGIQVVETGDQPRFLQTIPGRDAALLVDVGASDIAYIETSEGKSSVSYYQNLPSANAIKVAPDGKHAVAYFDISRAQQGKFETLQDVSVLTIGAGGQPLATRMTVGFKPRMVTFAGGESGNANAYVVTEDGISILSLASIDAQQKSAIAELVPVFGPTEDNKGADISVTPDGAYAVGRLENSTILRLVEITNKQAHSLDLASLLPAPVTPVAGTGGASGTGGTSNAGGSFASVAGSAGSGNIMLAGAAGTSSSATTGGAASGGVSARSTGTGGNTSGSATTTVQEQVVPDITDLDVAPNGKFALAVSRSHGMLLRVPIPEGFDDPSLVTKLKISDVTVGAASISPNGNWAILYTTVVESERRIVIVDLTGAVEPRVLDLTKSIRGIAFSSSGDQAYVEHTKVPGAKTDPNLSDQTILDRSYGYSLVDLKMAFRKLMITEAEPKQSVTTPNTPYVFLTFHKPSTEVQRLDMSSLQVDKVQLGSPPISIGAVTAAQRMFVSQEHDSGRLTFIDWADLSTQTVTGYELNSKIRE